MRRIPCILLATAALAQDTATIDWSKALTTAFADAKKRQKPIMICVNAKFVRGSDKVEPAAKGLREVVYKDERVVAKSRDFVCAMITPSSGTQEFGELRLLGIEGDIVSPQHIFVHPEGDRILARKEYWSHGKGEPAVKALLALMDEAQKALAGPDEKADGKVGGPSGDRAGWIAERIREVAEGNRPTCKRAVELLIEHDKDGDCLTPLLALLPEQKKENERLVVVVRALGRDGVHAAAPPVAEFLSHKEDAVRGNAAVTLEYIGSRDRKVVSALRKAASREKDEAIANHMYRALGRCGVGDGGARSALLKAAASGKSEFASYGPAIGLSYFEGDRRAARGVEKILKRLGVPGGRRGAGQNAVKRGVVSWTLASIGDEDSGDFVREELLAKLEHTQAFWVEPLRRFYESVAKKCDGDAEAMAAVEQGVRGIVAFVRGAGGAEERTLRDDYRKGREGAGFEPRGERLLGD